MLRRYSEFLHYFQPRHSMHEDILTELMFRPSPCASSRYRNRRAFHNDQRMYDCKTLQFSALHHLPTVPESIESDFALCGGTWLGISNVRTRQTKLITIIASTTFSIAPTPRAERS